MIQAYSALGSFDRPWRKEGSLTSGTPSTGFEVLDHPTVLRKDIILGPMLKVLSVLSHT